MKENDRQTDDEFYWNMYNDAMTREESATFKIPFFLIRSMRCFYRLYRLRSTGVSDLEKVGKEKDNRAAFCSEHRKQLNANAYL